MSYSADTSASPNPAWGPGWRHRGGCRAGRWRPLELLAMILGFMVFWPIGLAVIFFKLWQNRSGYQGDMFTFAHERAEEARRACRGWSHNFNGPRGFRSTGNSAFDEWRAGELARLEEERRKLEAAEREFSEHIENLRRARDREEFDRFMRARGAGGGQAL